MQVIVERYVGQVPLVCIRVSLHSVSKYSISYYISNGTRLDRYSDGNRFTLFWRLCGIQYALYDYNKQVLMFENILKLFLWK